MPEPVIARCPRCGALLSQATEGGGICLRCLGERALEFATLNVSNGGPMMPTVSLDPPKQTAPGDRAASFVRGSVADQSGEVVGASAAPQRLGAYELIEEIGRGGMGVVFAARHTRLGTLVALKVIGDGRFATAEQEMRFVREAQTAARLRHPHIVAVHDAGRDMGVAYYAMDLVPDGDLSQRLRERKRPLAAREAAGLVHKIAMAVVHAHREGFLHRDLKPSNILLEGEEPRVADFGLAAQIGPGGELTAATRLLGTPQYLAPEIAARGTKAASAASDVYALGAILYETLTGRPPFFGAAAEGDVGATPIAAVGHHDVVAPRLLAPGLPRDLETIALKCLEKNPSSRFASAEALADDLGRYLEGRPIVARPISAAARFARWCRRRPALAAVWFLAIALAFGSSAAAVMIFEAREETRQQLGVARHAEARAHALTRRLGRRADALAAVAATAQIQPSVDLRNTAIAALALQDLEIVRRWPVKSEALAFAQFDPSGAGYALMRPSGMVWHETGTDREWSSLRPAEKVFSVGMPGFSPDGRRLAMHASNETIHLWERTDAGARIVWSLTDRPFPWPRFIHVYGRDLACSPDGRFVTAAAKGGGFTLHDMKDGRELGRWSDEFMPTFVAWSPDGRKLAVGNAARESRGRWHLIDAATLKTERTIETGANIYAATWTLAGDLIVIANDKGEIRMYRARDGELVRLITAGNSAVERMAFLGDDRSLLTSMGGESIFRWRSRQNGEEFLVIEPVQSNAISVSADGQSLYTTNGSDEGLHFRVLHPAGLRLFPVDADAPSRSYAGPGSVSFSHDGAYVSATQSGGLSITRIADGRCLAKYHASTPREFLTATFAPDGNSLYVCGTVDGVFRLPLRHGPDGLSFGEKVVMDPSTDHYLRDLSDDGKKLLVVCPRQGRVKIFTIEAGHATLTAEWTTPGAYGAAFGDGGRSVLVNHDDTLPNFKSEGIRVWDIATRKPVRTLDAPVSADAEWNDRAGVAITTNGKGQSLLWRTDSWTRGPSLPADVQGNSTCFSIAPDGRVVAIGTARGVHLIAVEDGRTLAVLTRGVAFGYPNAVLFSPDGQQLAALNGDSLVHVWNLPALRAELKKLKLDW